jgi:hypothetical protein
LYVKSEWSGGRERRGRESAGWHEILVNPAFVRIRTDVSWEEIIRNFALTRMGQGENPSLP